MFLYKKIIRIYAKNYFPVLYFTSHGYMMELSMFGFVKQIIFYSLYLRYTHIMHFIEVD